MNHKCEEAIKYFNAKLSAIQFVNEKKIRRKLRRKNDIVIMFFCEKMWSAFEAYQLIDIKIGKRFRI